MDQSRQQTRAQHVHVTELNGLAQHHGFRIPNSELRTGDEGLSLRFVQAEAGENLTGLGDLVIMESNSFAPSAPRGGVPGFFPRHKAVDILDQIHLAFQIHAPGGNLESAVAR